MTEEEMKTKTCPLLSEYLFDKCGSTPKFMEGNCVGSDCALWGWKMSPKDAAMLSKIGKEQEPQGYCGLTRGE